MAQQLRPELIQRIIELVSPYMLDTDERHYHIDFWCVANPNLFNQIKWEGTPRTFTNNVVRLFLRHGSSKQNKTPLQYFLESIQRDMGEAEKTEIDRILLAIEEPTIAAPDTPTPHTPPSAERKLNQKSCALIITFVSVIFSLVIVIYSRPALIMDWVSGEKPTPVGVAMVVTSQPLPTSTSALSVPTATNSPIATPEDVAPTRTLTQIPPTSTLIPIFPTPTVTIRSNAVSIIPTATPAVATTLTPIAPTPTTSPIIEPTVPSTLTVTSTPIVTSPIEPVCLSIIDYDDENALRAALMKKAGFNQSDNLVFDNGDIFAEVCVTRE